MSEKPVWPYPNDVERRRQSDPGMTAHMASGQWSKKCRGKVYYFGPLSDPAAALAKYKRVWPSIKAGRPIPSAFGSTVSVKDLTNLFFDRMKRRGKAANTLANVRTCMRTIGPILGLTRDAQSLGPQDFARLRASIDDRDPETVKKLVNYTRAMFRWAHESQLIDSPVSLGPDFDGPNAMEMAFWQDRRRRERPPLVSPESFAALLDAAEEMSKRWPNRTTNRWNNWTRAALLMAMNCGFNARDLSIITPQHLRMPKTDDEPGWLDATRAKNAMPRLGELWPETVAAIRPFVERAARLEPIFLTRRGDPIVGGPGRNAMKSRFTRLREIAGCEHHVFTDLRRTFSTIALAMSDQETVRVVMGHSQSKNITMRYAQMYPAWKVRNCCRGVRSVMLRQPWERVQEDDLDPKTVAREVFG